MSFLANETVQEDRRKGREEGWKDGLCNVSEEISAMGDAEIDSYGRFTIPQTVRETLNIKKQVLKQVFENIENHCHMLKIL